MTPTYTEMFRVFGRIGLLSFGGPAAQIGLMHKELVEDRDWLSQEQYLRAISFCMLLPGPEAMQLATYAGWRQRGILGGLLAGLLFVIPGALVIAALALAYTTYGNLPWVQAMFLGVKPLAWGIAIVSFIALFVFAAPFPLVILIAAIIGGIGMSGQATPIAAKLSWSAPLKVVILGSILWALPITLVAASGSVFLTDIGLFFSKLAVVSFGGAYAVLAYMTQTVVADYGWITTQQMMDVTLWVTFVPCFIWIFAGAPLIDWIAGQPRLQGALAGITAAVVGVFANLTLWFALHVFFASVSTVTLGPVQLAVPDFAAPVWIAVGLAVIAGWLLLRRGMSLLLVLGIVAALALFLHLIGVT